MKALFIPEAIESGNIIETVRERILCDGIWLINFPPLHSNEIALNVNKKAHAVLRVVANVSWGVYVFCFPHFVLFKRRAVHLNLLFWFSHSSCAVCGCFYKVSFDIINGGRRTFYLCCMGNS